MNSWAVVGRARIAGDERARVEGLRHLCETAEPLDLKIELDEAGDDDVPVHFLAIADGQVIGYAGITTDDDPEACGMVHPAWRRRGVATALLGEVRAAAARFGRSSLLVICEEAGPVALAWMERLGADRAASERRMTVRLASNPGTGASGRGTPLELRRPTPDDRHARAALLMDRFAETPAEVDARLGGYAGDEGFVAVDGGAVVGTLRLTTSAGRTMIYGFVIDRDRRRQGLGSRMLEAVLDRLRSAGVAEVGLEVDPVNTPAVRLYERFGFVTVTTYRYMRLRSGPASR